MENITPDDAPVPLTALARYDQAVAQFAPTSSCWMEIADHLRREAEQHTGGQRTKRIDRALDCESRALASRTADAARRERAAVAALSTALAEVA
jgi:hypothetical protein